MADGSPPGTMERRILVVEDDAIVGMSLSAVLEGFGATVTWVTDLEGALAAIAADRGFDVALVDLNLDGTRSIPVLDRLAAADTPAVLCTGYDLCGIEERFQHLPRCEKPFTRAKIEQYLSAYLPVPATR